MWKLINVKKEHLEQYFTVGEEIIVGRKDANLMIANDPSVSRKHATLCVKHPEENVGNPSKSSSLFLRDQGSKYGTFKNGVRVSSEEELKNNDVVKFGQFESEYGVCKLPLVVTTSCLEVSEKRELKRTVHSLGGHFISEWQPSCSHLVMSEVKVTIKAVCCLCSAKPIVKPQYFLDLKNSIKNLSTFIHPCQYIPPIGEALIDKEKVSFDVNDSRKELFKGKMFFFLDEKQYKKLHLGILLGGGQASILSSEEVTSDVLLQEGCCVIESSQSVGNSFQEVISILQLKKLRMIPESDVGLAVAYCSTEKFCNPQFSMADAVLQSQKLQSQTLTEREVYVPDTQERLMRDRNAKDVASVACNSLNFSSFHAGAAEEMDISEIPLSNQVKRELDDIFDDPMDEEVENLSTRNSKSFVPNSLDKTRKLKREPSELINEVLSFNDQNDSPSGRKRKKSLSKMQDESVNTDNSSTKKEPIKSHKGPIKSEESYINGDAKESISVNGIKKECKHLTEINQGFHEPELPRNLIKVEVVPLICKRNVTSLAVQEYKNSSVKNFKKFKKVYSKRAQTLPRIVGAHELIPYDKIASQICNEAWDDPAEEAPQPIKGAFDWDTPTV